ncbi:MAG: glycoside hydrolase family 95 protein [Pseudomonadota bacterium]
MKDHDRGFSRRAFLGASVCSPLLASPGMAVAIQTSAECLRYRRPASRWEEALPLGNGRLGAMVFGRVAQERLQLNEDTLWAGGPYTPDNPDALAAIPQVRKLIDAGEYKAAAELASAKVMAKPLQQMPYGTLGDILLDFADAVIPDAYERSLDLDTAVAKTTYRTKAGHFVREAFVSAPHQVIVMRIGALEGTIDFGLVHRGPRAVRYSPANYQGSATALVKDESVDWLTREDVEARAGLTLGPDGEGCLLVRGRNETASGIAAGLSYALRIQVLADGKVENTAAGVTVHGAREAVILIAAATSFVSFQDVSGDPVSAVRKVGADARATNFEQLKRAHIRAYQKLYRTVSLQLRSESPAAESMAGKTTDVRIAAAETSDDPALAALYFQYSRYLLISSSRPGSQPANLQGIWNQGTSPPWGSKYTININTEMNYWFADPAGLASCFEPLVRLIEDLSISGSKTARTLYGARGWVAHHNTDLWRATAPIDGPLWGLWPCGGAWLCNALWDHYDYSRDSETLRRIYPLLRGASLFFLDTLVEDPEGRGLVTSPSLSPENAHPFGSSLCAGPAMDRQILRDLFAHTVEAGTLLAQDRDLLSQFAATALRLPKDRIGAQGQLQEWLADWDARAPEQQHRHVSHLYGVFPSSQINVKNTPDLIAAAKVSLRTRGDLATGWGTAWRLCLWARMGEAEHAHSILKSLLGPQRTYPNMFDAHPPFQIDGNFGGAAGVLEMLIQSWGDEIRLLPALPAAWPSGEARGLRARGGISVTMDWRAGRLRRVSLAGPARSSVKLLHGGIATTIKLDSRGQYRQVL